MAATLVRCSGSPTYVERALTRRESQALFGPSIKQDAAVRHQLIQKVEVRDVTR